MRIRTFASLIETRELTRSTLRDTVVVVDGQNFFYETYEQSGLPSTFGIEGDRYARYLRGYLAMFKRANIKCYFLFKGGHEDLAKRLTWNNEKWSTVPVFMKEIYKEILDEMGFEYVVCEYESKRDVIELAQHLNCPVISRDIEFCFSGSRYIPSTTLKFNDRGNTISCGYFLLADFLKKYRLTNEKMAMFLVLRDERIFPAEKFSDYFVHLKAPRPPFQRNLHLLEYMSAFSKEQVLITILKCLSKEDKKAFHEEEAKVRKMIGRRESGGLGAAYMLDRGAGRVARADPRWFAKGVAAGHVAINYINLYRSKAFYGVGPIMGFDNPILISIDIIYYAYDLLTDFKNDGFTLIYEIDWRDEQKQTMKVARTHGITKPAYEARGCVFENGWGSVASLGLLAHFACSALGLASLRRLERAPAPARLLLLALAYCARRRPAAPAALPAAVLLTQVMLDVVADNHDKNNLPKFPFDRKPILDSITDRSAVSESDCGIAAVIMEEYYHASDSDAELTVDRKLLHALAEFQQCLLQLCALNALCGAELPAPALARTYNGTLAYNLLRAADGSPDQLLFLRDLMNPAPTVYAYFIGLLRGGYMPGKKKKSPARTAPAPLCGKAMRLLLPRSLPPSICPFGG